MSSDGEGGKGPGNVSPVVARRMPSSKRKSPAHPAGRTVDCQTRSQRNGLRDLEGSDDGIHWDPVVLNEVFYGVFDAGDLDS